MESLAPIDVEHEGRLSVVESKIDRITPMVEDLHADMLSRRARFAFVRGLTRYGFWVVAGAVGLLGLGTSDRVFSWLTLFPH